MSLLNLHWEVLFNDILVEVLMEAPSVSSPIGTIRHEGKVEIPGHAITHDEGQKWMRVPILLNLQLIHSVRWTIRVYV